MKIALVMDQFDIVSNGITVSARRMVDALARRGHEVRIVTTGESGPNRYIVRAKDTGIVSYFAKKQKMILGIPEQSILREAFKGVDVVHFMMPFHLSRIGKKIADEMKIPTTTAFHVQAENITFNIGMGKSKLLPKCIYSLYREVFYKNFKYIHCPSDFIAQELKDNGYTSKLYVISNGVDTIFKKKENPALKEQFKNKFVILMIGRYSPEKRQDVLIEAIAKSNYNQDIQLILAGTGPTEEKLKKLSGEKLKNSCIFGFFSQQQLIDVINSADLYVHASEIEIEAISCIEAFTCGIVPIICNSEKSATKQFAIDERSLFARNDSTDLCHKIEYFMKHEKERKQLSEQYSEKAAKYGIEQSIDQLERMFLDAIEGK